MDSDPVWQHIDNERAWLADLLVSLPPEGWRQPSLCEGWTVRDVGAHLTFAHTRVRDLLWPAVRAGFRYDAVVKDTALSSPLTHQEIVATLRGFVGSRRRVAFITDLEPLIDILVHNQDICRPWASITPCRPMRPPPQRPGCFRRLAPSGDGSPRTACSWSPRTLTGRMEAATRCGHRCGPTCSPSPAGRPSRQGRQPRRDCRSSPAIRRARVGRKQGSGM
jgi:hypothetical protein